MRPPSSPSEGLFDPIFTTDEVAGAVSDEAWVQAMLDVEAALARAASRAGLVPAAEAAVIAEHCQASRFDAAALGREAARSGSPVIPLVRALTGAVPEPASRHVHHGATSQDVLDTAAMLVCRRALAPLLADLSAAAESCAGLARAHRMTVMAGRSMLQQALPVTFGLKAAGWLSMIGQARARLADVRDARLAVQLGGAAGTLASLGGHGTEVAGLLADELGLAEPVLPWHTDRTRVAEVATALGMAAATLGKVARDVVLLAQTEVAEVAEPHAPGRGGSSTMPHKRNPVGAVLTTAAALRAPGLVATVLAAAVQEHERAAGGWHAEWEPLTDLLRIAGGAAARMREVLGGLEVDPERMAANLRMTDGLLMAEHVATVLAGRVGRLAAHDLVEAAAGAAAGGRSLREVLLDDPAVREHLTPDELDAALDPAAYLGSAGAFVDRALDAHRRPAGEPA